MNIKNSYINSIILISTKHRVIMMNKQETTNNELALKRFLMDIEILDKLENQVSTFNAFEVLNIVHTEIRHSNVLAWLLSPKENHGLGDYILRKVVETVVYSHYESISNPEFNPLQISLMDYYDFTVHREWKNIDLMAVSEINRFVIVIENKVWSDEGVDQLKKYTKIVESEFTNYNKLFIYLTPFGSKSSMPKTWLSLNYEKIIEVIDKGLSFNRDFTSKRVRLFIEQYIEIVRRYIVKDHNLEEICREIYFKHKKALDLIFEYKPDIYSDISNDIQDMISQYSELNLDTSNKIYIRFTTKFLDKLIAREGKGWTSSKRILLFELQNRTDSLVLKLMIGPGNDDIREKIHQIALNNPSLFKGINRNLSPQFTQIYSKEIMAYNFESEFEYNNIISKIKKELDRFIYNELKLLEDSFSKLS